MFSFLIFSFENCYYTGSIKAQGLSYPLDFHQSDDRNPLVATYDAMAAKILRLRSDLRLRSEHWNKLYFSTTLDMISNNCTVKPV